MAGRPIRVVLPPPLPRPPRQVRRHVAEQLYLQLLVADTVPCDEADAAAGPAPAAGPGDVPAFDEASHEAALEVLLTTAWDGPLEGARAARNQLAGLLGLQVKTRLVTTGKGAAGGGVAGWRVADDENASYQALLNDAARGGGY